MGLQFHHEWFFLRLRHTDAPAGSDAYLADFDGDQLPNGMELVLGRDPFQITPPPETDGDLDGFSDFDEFMHGTDSQSAASYPNPPIPETGLSQFPVQVVHQRKDVSNFWQKWMGSDDIPGYSAWVSSESGTDYYDVYEPRWSGVLQALQYPSAAPEFWLTSGSAPTAISHHQYTYSSSSEIHTNMASVLHLRVALRSSQLQPWPVSQKLLKIRYDRSVPSGSPIPSSDGFVTFTIPQGGRISNSVELTPSMANETRRVEYLSNFEFTPLGYSLGVDETVQPPWLMLPQAIQRRFYVDSAASSLIPLTFAAAGGDISAAAQTVSQNTGLIEFNGPTEGDTGELRVGVASSSILGEPIGRFAVLPRRILKLTLHPIAYKSSTSGVVEAEPQHIPAAQELEDYLDMVYGSQVNVYFEVTVRPMEAVAYDIGTGNVGIGQPDKGVGNGILDVCYPKTENYTSAEEKIIKDTTHDPEANLNVYLVAANAGVHSGLAMLDLRPDPLQPPQQPPIAGPPWWITDEQPLAQAGKATTANQGIIWVWDYPFYQIGGVEYRPDHKWTIAHEIGHYIGDLRHSTYPWSWNPSYVPNTDNELRLMTGNGGPKRATNPPWLVKPEWMSIQNWLEENL